MGNIVNLQDFLSDKKFHSFVVPFFRDVNPYFTNYKDGNEAVFILDNEKYVFIFIRFVPNGVRTSFPAIEDCFHEYRLKNRISSGEWVVETFEEVEYEKARKILNEMKTVEDTSAFNFITSVIRK